MVPALLAAVLIPAQTPSSETIPLWSSGAPGSEARKAEAETKPNPWSIGNIHNPTLTVHRPAPGAANGTAVVIAPGGGHRELVVGAEGTEPAQFFAKLGVTAFVLKYRLAREAGSGLTVDKDTRADAFRAMRLVRSRAKDFGVLPDRIGMMGFSAGGEVLSMAVFGPGPTVATPDVIDAAEARPDFAIWIYPGPLGIPAEVPANAPPAFLLVSNDDGAANVVLDLTRKYRAAKASVELHLLHTGGHGFNMGNRSKLATVNTWPKRLEDWLGDRGLLARP